MTTIALFYIDSNFGGTPFGLLTTTNLSVADLSQGFPNLSNRISSLQCLDPNYVVQVFTGVNFTGTRWDFRAPTVARSLSQYGLNDNIKSVRAVYDARNIGTATFFQDFNLTGKSMYAPGNAKTIISDNTPNTGAIGNDTLSSMWLYDRTKVTLYRDTFFVNQLGNPITNTTGNTIIVNLPSDLNDRCSSYRVETIPI